jgi:hypothetical protein
MLPLSLSLIFASPMLPPSSAGSRRLLHVGGDGLAPIHFVKSKIAKGPTKHPVEPDDVRHHVSHYSGPQSALLEARRETEVPSKWLPFLFCCQLASTKMPCGF